MKKKSSLFLVLLVTVSLTLLYQFSLSETKLFASYRLKSIDSLFAWRSKHSEPLAHFKDIVIIGVDDDSYRRLNKAWPWDRSVYAVFLENLQKHGPKIVGFDFSFVGKSQNESADQRFADSMKINKNVILASTVDPGGHLIPPLDIFSDAAAGVGFIDKPYDIDLVNRRSKSIVSLASNNGGGFSFGTWLAYSYWGLEPSNHISLANDRVSWDLLNEDDQTEKFEKSSIRTGFEGNQWISFRYQKNSFHYIPFWKVMTSEVKRDEIKNKLVLVGLVSPLFHDIHPTPFGLMAGIDIIANETLSILDHDFVQEVPFIFRLSLWLILVIFFTVIFFKFDFIKSFVILAACEAALYGASLALFLVKNRIFEPFSPMVIVATCYLITVFYKSFRIYLENMALQKMVITDGLTGLYGHRYLSLRLNAEFDRSRETKSNFCFVMFDIDFFKKVNDIYGHEIGNTVLVSVAGVLKNGIRGYDLAARYGGEEFSLILFKIEEDIAHQTVERIRSAIGALTFNSPKGDFPVTISAGICSSNNPEVRSKDDLIRLADQALYQAKSQGRNQTCIYKVKTASTPIK